MAIEAFNRRFHNRVPSEMNNMSVAGSSDGMEKLELMCLSAGCKKKLQMQLNKEDSAQQKALMH